MRKKFGKVFGVLCAVPTRWGTRFAMLDRLIKLKQSLMAWATADDAGINIREEIVQKIMIQVRWKKVERLSSQSIIC
ncbi:hypothetical protein PsorP6_019588 [Peronosclerospora sorghi]|nr:hypothetical protein PsorP6_019588 [Peronosclerospora sorghi]